MRGLASAGLPRLFGAGLLGVERDRRGHRSDPGDDFAEPVHRDGEVVGPQKDFGLVVEVDAIVRVHGVWLTDR